MTQSQKSTVVTDATPLSELEVKRLRLDFPIFETKIHGKPLIYLDSAATTLKPKQVVDVISAHYLYKASNVHRGIHTLSEEATAAFENVRGQVQKFIGAQDASEIIFTKGTTDSINLVAQSYGRKFLEAGDEILISEMEHHSNIVPWQMLCEEKGCVLKVIPVDVRGDLLQDEFEKLLSHKVKIMSITAISNTLGTINPLAEMIRKAHDYNIVVLVDAAQAVMHNPIDVVELNCDFLAFSAHKMLGPTGLGVLYGKAELLNRMPPVQGGGAMIEEVSFAKTTYNTIPYKFEAGTPHIAGVLGLGAAIDYLNAVGLKRIFAYEHELLELARREMQGIEGITWFGQAKQQASILSFVLAGVHPHDLGTLIDHEGVAVRTGHHCTQPLLKKFGFTAATRASFAFYNTQDEVRAFVQALIKVKGLF